MKLKNTFLRNGTRWVLTAVAALARPEPLKSASDAVLRSLAAAAAKTWGIRKAESVEDLGRQWQRGFPSAKQLPIVKVTGDTVYAEIHTPCPLRGTGEVMTCHRMMEYDRALLRHAGGQFKVLGCQAEPGRTHCSVAMRLDGADMSDLVEPHERARPA